MKPNHTLRILRSLSLFAQLGTSFAVPLLLCILGSRWLMNRFALDRWIMAVGILLGIGSAVFGLLRCIRQMLPTDGDENSPASFNEHK